MISASALGKMTMRSTTYPRLRTRARALSLMASGPMKPVDRSLSFSNEPLQSAELNLSVRFPLLQSAQGLADDLTGVVVITGLTFAFTKLSSFGVSEMFNIVTMQSFVKV